ncbi:hypothetical protein YC2023_082332 [Brassica napus]
MDHLEESGDFGVFWSLLSAKLHSCVRCLAVDGDLFTVRLKWLVCIARGSCRGDEGLLTDGEPLTSVDVRRERRNSFRVLLELHWLWFLYCFYLFYSYILSMIFCDNFMSE